LLLAIQPAYQRDEVNPKEDDLAHAMQCVRILISHTRIIGRTSFRTLRARPAARRAVLLKASVLAF
jgi:hypothetical protein